MKPFNAFNISAVLILLSAIALTGCIPVSPNSPGGGYNVGGAAITTTNSPQADEVKYTVHLMGFTGPQHSAMAKSYKNFFKDKQNWKNLFVVTGQRGSDLYWGIFDSYADADPTLKKAQQYKTDKGVAIFVAATITNVPGTDRSLAKYDLVNNHAHYSLLVASFEDVPEANYTGRMKFAEKYCRQLRDQGFEAWYYHGRTISNVTVGSFGPEAVKITTERVLSASRRDYIMVEKKTVVSPELLQLQEKFPKLIYNGYDFYEVTKDAAGNVIKRAEKPKESYAVVIPKK